MQPLFSHYRLEPTDGAPALIVDGVLMHRVSGTSPERDARDKVRLLGIRGGRVLDTCAGLGYSAQEAARRGAWVLTCEVDPGVVAIARTNPASAGLFDPARIALVLADVQPLVAACPEGVFSAILHDPPMLARAGDLYGRAFYADLYRVLAPGGALFHYVGEPGRRKGRDVPAGVARRLADVGFRVRLQPALGGVWARKVKGGGRGRREVLQP